MLQTSEPFFQTKKICIYHSCEEKNSVPIPLLISLSNNDTVIFQGEVIYISLWENLEELEHVLLTARWQRTQGPNRRGGKEEEETGETEPVSICSDLWVKKSTITLVPLRPLATVSCSLFVISGQVAMVT